MTPPIRGPGEAIFAVGLKAQLFDRGFGNRLGVKQSALSDLDDLPGHDLANRVVAIHQVKRS